MNGQIITPKQHLRNNFGEIIMERGVDYEIVRRHADVFIVQEVGSRTEHPIMKPWLIECGALEADAK